MLEEATEIILNWLSGVRIELAVKKTELILPTRKYKHNILQLSVKGQTITSKPCLKYLGVQLDQRMSFKAHAMAVAERADRASRSLRAIVPNLRGPKHRVRKLLATVSQSILLYGALIWSPRMSVRGWKILGSSQRRLALWVAAAYRTIFRDALLVLAGIPPINLLAKECAEIHEAQWRGENVAEARRVARTNRNNTWQERWQTPKKALGPGDLYQTFDHGSIEDTGTQPIMLHKPSRVTVALRPISTASTCWNRHDAGSAVEHQTTRCTRISSVRRGRSREPSWCRRSAPSHRKT